MDGLREHAPAHWEDAFLRRFVCVQFAERSAAPGGVARFVLPAPQDASEGVRRLTPLAVLFHSRFVSGCGGADNGVYVLALPMVEQVSSAGAARTPRPSVVWVAVRALLSAELGVEYLARRWLRDAFLEFVNVHQPPKDGRTGRRTVLHTRTYGMLVGGPAGLLFEQIDGRFLKHTLLFRASPGTTARGRHRAGPAPPCAGRFRSLSGRRRWCSHPRTRKRHSTPVSPWTTATWWNASCGACGGCGSQPNIGTCWAVQPSVHASGSAWPAHASPRVLRCPCCIPPCRRRSSEGPRETNRFLFGVPEEKHE